MADTTEGGGETQREQELLRAEKLAGVGRVAAQLAHQLNTPLASILLSAQSMQEGLARSEYADDLRIIVEQVRRCQAVVRRLQNFSRSSGQPYRTVNFCHLFHRVARILAHSFSAAGVELDFHIRRGRYLVFGDATDLEHALFALLENAMDAASPGSTIHVAMELDYAEGGLEFRVRDEGEGIPEGQEEAIFEPFFTTKPEGRGTGLGLCIARRILDRHGGSVQARRVEAGGAEFLVRLPLAPELVKAAREDPERVEVRAVPFEVLEARARGEFEAGCEVVGLSATGLAPEGGEDDGSDPDRRR